MHFMHYTERDDVTAAEVTAEDDGTSRPMEELLSEYVFTEQQVRRFIRFT